MMNLSERGVSSVPREEYPVKWTVPTAKWLADNRFSARGYYFGKEVQAALDVPVGVIAASWGATAIASLTASTSLPSATSEGIP